MTHAANDLQILVGEDDPVYRRFLERSLSKWGFDVRIASDGEETKQCLLGEDHPQLAIVDWNMPKLCGISVCQAVRERYSMSDVFILMLTARTESHDLAEALSAGANDYMSKPFDAVELRARLTVGRRLIGSTIDATEAREITTFHANSDLPAPTLRDALTEDGFLTPVFDPHLMRFNMGMPATLLRAWESDGTLQQVLVDRVQVCPKCRSLPSFRFGCPACGSGCVSNDKMIHHYACAHVGRAEDFDEDDQIVCPKCRARQLVVGADFEHLTGPYRCLTCDWSMTELEHVAHCLGCGFRFPAQQAVLEDLVGYHARRLDALGADASSI